LCTYAYSSVVQPHTDADACFEALYAAFIHIRYVKERE
jgi:hypothetical protein